MNIAPIRPPRWPLRPRRSPGSWPGAAARSSLTCRRPAAATSSSCSPRRCPGASCATSPGRSPSGSLPSTRRRWRLSAARSRRPARGTRAAGGGCSRRRPRTRGRPRSARTGRRCGRRCWPSSRPSCSRLSEPRKAAVMTRLSRSWMTPASRGSRGPAAGLPSAPSLTRWPAPGGGTGPATRAAARPAWPSWPRRRPAAGSWPTSGPRSAPEPGRASLRSTSGVLSRAGWPGSCPASGEKRSAS